MTDLQSRSEVSWRNGMMSEPHETIVRAYAESKLMTRAEWEASIDYEAALNELISRDYHRAAGVTMYGLKAVVDAALNIKEDS